MLVVAEVLTRAGITKIHEHTITILSINMGVGRILSWSAAALAVFIPLNWIWLWVTGDVAKDATLTQFLIGTLICWGFAGGLGYFLVVSARGIKTRKNKEEQELQMLLASPLTEMCPTQALIKADEKAYGAVMASLQEVKTVGYSASTSGVSVRVAKGVTLRTSGARGKAVKGMVSVASGELVITDKRVIFSGDRKSFAIPLNDLLNTTNYSDGFGFSNSKTTYTLITSNDRDRVLFGIALNKVIRG